MPNANTKRIIKYHKEKYKPRSNKHRKHENQHTHMFKGIGLLNISHNIIFTSIFHSMIKAGKANNNDEKCVLNQMYKNILL